MDKNLDSRIWNDMYIIAIPEQTLSRNMEYDKYFKLSVSIKPQPNQVMYDDQIFHE